MSLIQLTLLAAAVALTFRYSILLCRTGRISNWIDRTQRRNAALCQARMAQGAERPFIAVVIPALAEYETLPRTLTMLLRSVPPELADDFIFLVVTTEKERVLRQTAGAEV